MGMESAPTAGRQGQRRQDTILNMSKAGSADRDEPCRIVHCELTSDQEPALPAHRRPMSDGALCHLTQRAVVASQSYVMLSMEEVESRERDILLLSERIADLCNQVDHRNGLKKSIASGAVDAVDVEELLVEWQETYDDQVSKLPELFTQWCALKESVLEHTAAALRQQHLSGRVVRSDDACSSGSPEGTDHHDSRPKPSECQVPAIVAPPLVLGVRPRLPSMLSEANQSRDHHDGLLSTLEHCNISLRMISIRFDAETYHSIQLPAVGSASAGAARTDKVQTEVTSMHKGLATIEAEQSAVCDRITTMHSQLRRFVCLPDNGNVDYPSKVQSDMKTLLARLENSIKSLTLRLRALWKLMRQFQQLASDTEPQVGATATLGENILYGISQCDSVSDNAGFGGGDEDMIVVPASADHQMPLISEQCEEEGSQQEVDQGAADIPNGDDDDDDDTFTLDAFGRMVEDMITEIPDLQHRIYILGRNIEHRQVIREGLEVARLSKIEELGESFAETLGGSFDESLDESLGDLAVSSNAQDASSPLAMVATVATVDREENGWTSAGNDPGKATADVGQALTGDNEPFWTGDEISLLRTTIVKLQRALIMTQELHDIQGSQSQAPAGAAASPSHDKKCAQILPLKILIEDLERDLGGSKKMLEHHVLKGMIPGGI